MPTNQDLASDEALDAWLRQQVTTTQHISGTCKMGSASDPMAVVSQYGRVHGLDNLFVAGASAFPTAGFANPTLTILALSLRLADHLSVGGGAERRRT